MGGKGVGSKGEGDGGGGGGVRGVVRKENRTEKASRFPLSRRSG